MVTNRLAPTNVHDGAPFAVPDAVPPFEMPARSVPVSAVPRAMPMARPVVSMTSCSRSTSSSSISSDVTLVIAARLAGVIVTAEIVGSRRVMPADSAVTVPPAAASAVSLGWMYGAPFVRATSRTMPGSISGLNVRW
jgi:hypothetical protein